MGRALRKITEDVDDDGGEAASALLPPQVLKSKNQTEFSIKPFSVTEFDALRNKNAQSWFALQAALPDPKDKEKPFWLFFLAIGVSVMSSFYYKDFTKNFTKRSLTTLGSPYASQIADLCGWCSFLVNFFIGIRTLMDAYYKITEELPAKYKNANTGHLSDSTIRAFIILTIVASIIGVAPNLVFTYDTLMNRKSPLPFVVFNLFIQLIAVGTMNLRGITNIVDIDYQRKKAARNTRKQILTALNDVLDPSRRLTDKQIDLLSKGELYNVKYPILRRFIEGIAAVLPKFYCVGFFTSAVMFFAPLLIGAGIAMQLLMTLNIFVGIISLMLKLIFLAYANISLIKKIAGYIETPIINVPTMNDQFILPKALLIVSLIISLIISALSLGGPAGVVFNYITPNIGVAYMGGFLAAYGINAGDSFNLICAIVGYVYFRLKAFFEGKPFDVKMMPWMNSDDYIMSRMLRVAEMSDASIIKEFATKECSKVINDALEDDHKGQLKTGDKLYSNGIKYHPNEKMNNLLETCKELKSSPCNEFSFFKKHYHDKTEAFETLGISKNDDWNNDIPIACPIGG